MEAIRFDEFKDFVSSESHLPKPNVDTEKCLASWLFKIKIPK